MTRPGFMVYVAGPLTAGHGRTVGDNVAIATGAFLELVAAGIPAICPHASALIPGAFDVPYENWMACDFQAIERCDAILLLPDWERSSGTVRERGLAIALGKKVYHSVPELLAAEAGR